MWRERRPDRTRRPWLTLLVATLLGGVLGLLVHAVVPTQYSTSAYVVVSPATGADPSVAVAYTKALGRLVADPATLQPAARASGISVSDLARDVRSQSSPDAPLIEVTAGSTTAGGAARAANSVAGSFVSVLNQRTGDTHVRLSTLTVAPVPPEPSSLPVLRAMLVGLIAGLLLGALVVGVRNEHRRDDATMSPPPDPAGTTRPDSPSATTTS
jgi:capsular polysaccharide biosynthesis protein